MDHPPLRQPVTPDKASRKNTRLYGCLGALIGVPILLLVIGYYIVMHTAVPLRIVAKLVAQDDQITIEGVSGSISKGFAIENFRYTDGNGNQSLLEGLTLQWDDINRMRKNRELVIEQIGLRRAHLYIDTSDDASTSDSQADTSSTDSDSPSSHSSPDMLTLFEIKKVDIRSVVIESTTGDFKFELDEILMNGFRLQDDEFDLASLSVGSNFLDLQLQEATPTTIAGVHVPFKRKIVGSLKPEMLDFITHEVDFTIELGASGGEMVTRFRGFGGSVEAIDLAQLGYQAISLKDFSPADYFALGKSGPVSKLSIEIRTDSKFDSTTGLRSTRLESGRLTLGTTEFTMAPQVLSDDSTKDVSKAIVATGQCNELEITARLHETDQSPFYNVQLSSVPPISQQDLISQLWFRNPYSALTPDQAAEVDTIEKQYFPLKK